MNLTEEDIETCQKAFADLDEVTAIYDLHS
jgi:hypothetical protein